MLAIIIIITLEKFNIAIQIASLFPSEMLPVNYNCGLGRKSYNDSSYVGALT